MQNGTVKWFDEKKGYGFITPDGGGDDLFVHHSGIVMNGFKTLADGQPVTFESTPSKPPKKGFQAVNVKAV